MVWIFQHGFAAYPRTNTFLGVSSWSCGTGWRWRSTLLKDRQAVLRLRPVAFGFTTKHLVFSTEKFLTLPSWDQKFVSSLFERFCRYFQTWFECRSSCKLGCLSFLACIEKKKGMHVSWYSFGVRLAGFDGIWYDKLRRAILSLLRKCMCLSLFVINVMCVPTCFIWCMSLWQVPGEVGARPRMSRWRRHTQLTPFYQTPHPGRSSLIWDRNRPPTVKLVVKNHTGWECRCVSPFE